MAEGTAAAKEDEDGPKQPEPPELIVVGAAASFSTTVATLTDIGLIVHSRAQLSKLPHPESPPSFATAVPGTGPLHAAAYRPGQGATSSAGQPATAFRAATTTAPAQTIAATAAIAIRAHSYRASEPLSQSATELRQIATNQGLLLETRPMETAF